MIPLRATAEAAAKVMKPRRETSPASALSRVMSGRLLRTAAEDDDAGSCCLVIRPWRLELEPTKAASAEAAIARAAIAAYLAIVRDSLRTKMISRSSRLRSERGDA